VVAVWSSRSWDLQRYLAEVRAIEDTRIDSDVETVQLRIIREKRRLHARLLWTRAGAMSRMARSPGIASTPTPPTPQPMKRRYP